MSTAATAFAPPEGLVRRQAWWGARYVGAMCAQAGYSWVETPAEGDVHSIDGAIYFRTGLPVSVQVKCSQRPLRRCRSWSIEDAWRKNWTDLYLPAYFVHVSVPPDIDDWVEHGQNPWSTRLQTAAFWARIDPLLPGQKSIKVRASSRLTVETFDEWAEHLRQKVDSSFTGGGQP